MRQKSNVMNHIAISFKIIAIGYFLCLSCLSSYGAIERTPCAVHTLQLVVNMIHKEVSKDSLTKYKKLSGSSASRLWQLSDCCNCVDLH